MQTETEIPFDLYAFHRFLFAYKLIASNSHSSDFSVSALGRRRARTMFQSKKFSTNESQSKYGNKKPYNNIPPAANEELAP